MNSIQSVSRKFKPPEFFSPPHSAYFLLPFRFTRISDDKEVLVNEVGDFLVVPTGTAAKVIYREVSPQDELYFDLISHFFISEHPVPKLLELLATRYRTKKSFLDNFTSLHIFVITLRCEHTCHYCQVSRVSSDKAAFDMEFRHIDKGIALMMQSPNPHVTMEFQGGEALMAFDKIRYAVEQAQIQASQIGKRITFVICSNLALISDEILIFCKANDILLSTSLDGPEFIHNRNRHRPGNNSYELTVAGIKKARTILGQDKVSALLTTSVLTIDHPREVVQAYFDNGFRNIFLRPISPYGFATKNERKNFYNTEDFLFFYKQAFMAIIDYNLRGEFFREDYATIILKKILTPFPVGYVDLQSPAGMVNSVIVFNYDGKIFASDEARMLAEMKDFTFLLGTLDTHSYNEIFYGEKAKNFSNAWLNETLPGCSECAFQAYCGADPVFNHATQGNMFGHRPTGSFCKRNMEIIRFLLELMSENRAIETIFRSWVNSSV